MTYSMDVRTRRASASSSYAHLRRPALPTTVAKRPYHVAWLGIDGRVGFDTVRGAALPVLESACASLARGTLVATQDGPVAVEDLMPGMRVMTPDHGAQVLRWVGSYDISAHELRHPSTSTGRLYRVTSDTFGMARPAQDLILGQRAHLMLRQPGCEAIVGEPRACCPIRAFEDGMSVIPLNPLSDVSLFNLAFDKHSTVLANGVEVESFHPGPHADSLRDDAVKYALLGLFPHVSSLKDFGPQKLRRLTIFEARSLREGH